MGLRTAILIGGGLLAATLCAALTIDPQQGKVLEAAKPKASQVKDDPCYAPEKGFVGWRNCLRLGQPQRMRGVWYASFLDDYFVENATTVPSELEVDAPELTTALDIDRVAAFKRAGQLDGAWCIRAFAVEFNGRRPTEDMTKFDLRPEKLVLVDKLSSVRFVRKVRLNGAPEDEQNCGRPPKEITDYLALEGELQAKRGRD